MSFPSFQLATASSDASDLKDSHLDIKFVADDSQPVELKSAVTEHVISMPENKKPQNKKMIRLFFRS